MKILWLSNSPTAPSAYGKVSDEVCNRLVERGYEVINAGTQTQAGHFPYKNLTVLGRLRHPFFRDVFREYTEIHKPDFVITFTNIWTIYWLPQDFGNWAKRWIAYTPIEGEVDEACIPILNPAREALAVIVPSRYSYNQLRKYLDNVYLFEHGVNSEYYPISEEERGLARKSLGLSDDDFLFGFVGMNIFERKDFPRLLKAFGAFLERNPEARAWLYLHTNLVAAEPDRMYPIDLLARKYKVDHRLKTPRYNPELRPFTDSEMRALYSSFDCYVSASRAEGFGVPILEAAACGTPAIAPANTSQIELVEGHGWLVNCNDSVVPVQTLDLTEQRLADFEDLVSKMEYVYYHHDEVKEMGKKAREFSLRYNWDRLIDEQLIPALEENKPYLEVKEGVNRDYLSLIPKRIYPGKVLDLGCGLTQPYKPYLEKLGEYVGFDSRVKGRGVVQGDAHNLPFKDKEFGLVFCTQLLEHVANPHRVLEEAKRVAESGVIIFPTPLASNFAKDPDHKVVDIDAPINSDGEAIVLW